MFSAHIAQDAHAFAEHGDVDGDFLASEDGCNGRGGGNGGGWGRRFRGESGWYVNRFRFSGRWGRRQRGNNHRGRSKRSRFICRLGRGGWGRGGKATGA